MSEVVRSYADLISHDDLRPSEADAVARALEATRTGAQSHALWLPEWLAEKKDLGFEKGPNVTPVVLVRETEKAWYVDCDGYSEWIPKSVAALFERHPEAEIHSPQAGLDGFEEGSV